MTDFDPLKMVQDSVNSGFDPSAIDDMDEREMDWAPNIVEWILNAKYLDVKTIYPQQLQCMLQLFGDVCPWCSDADFLSKDFPIDATTDNILDRLTLMQNGKCPKCGKTKCDQYKEKMWSFPHEIALLWGMRSGKSAVTGIVASYILHQALRIPDPALHFRLLKGSELAMRFIALTAQQAKETNWMQFTSRVQTSNWFPRYHDFLKYYEKKKGIEIVRWLMEKFEYKHKALLGYPFGASIDTSRGRTALFTAFDEIGWWLGGDTAHRANPHETYAAYEAASQTLRNVSFNQFMSGNPNALTAMMMSVSSTSSKTDYIMRLIKRGKVDSRMVTSHKASWEVNPEFTYSPELIEQARLKDPRNFSRNFGSIPPFTSDPFIEKSEIVLRSAVLPHPKWDVELNQTVVGGYYSAEKIATTKDVPYCLALDLGHNNCGYAAALLRLKEDDFSIAQVAGLWSIYPQGGQAVDIDGMFKFFIEKFCERQVVRLVLYDQWQSKSQIQSLVKSGIKAQQYSLTYKDFVSFRSQLLQGKLESVIPEIPIHEVETRPDTIESILYPRPYLHFLWQTLSVSEIGNKVTKGDGHDDLFRAVVLGTRFMWDDVWKKQFEYRGGVIGTTTKGKCVGVGTSVSGQSYSNQANGHFRTASANRRTLGSIVPRTKGNV